MFISTNFLGAKCIFRCTKHLKRCALTHLNSNLRVVFAFLERMTPPAEIRSEGGLFPNFHLVNHPQRQQPTEGYCVISQEFPPCTSDRVTKGTCRRPSTLTDLIYNAKRLQGRQRESELSTALLVGILFAQDDVSISQCRRSNYTHESLAAIGSAVGNLSPNTLGAGAAE